jgi:hypothetical protein
MWALASAAVRLVLTIAVLITALTAAAADTLGLVSPLGASSLGPLVGAYATDQRTQCSRRIECPFTVQESFLSSVQLDCYRDPLLLTPETCVRVRVKTMVDYILVNSDTYVFVVLKEAGGESEANYDSGEVLYEQVNLICTYNTIIASYFIIFE